MLQTRLKASLPIFYGMPRELLVEPYVDQGAVREPSVKAHLDALESCGSLYSLIESGSFGYAGALGGSYIRRLLAGYGRLGLKGQMQSRCATTLYPRNGASYRVLSLMGAFGGKGLAMRNVIAAKGSLGMNLQRIIFQETRLPRRSLKNRIHDELGITVPESTGRLNNKYRTELTFSDVACLDLALAALGSEVLYWGRLWSARAT